MTDLDQELEDNKQVFRAAILEMVIESGPRKATAAYLSMFIWKPPAARGRYTPVAYRRKSDLVRAR